MRTTAIHNLIIRRPQFSLFPSLSSFSLCSHSSITFSRLCNHTHTIIIICSRYARRALASCSLFKIFLPFSQLLLSSDHSKRGQGERERERDQRRKRRKEICVQITQIFYEWTHRGEKGKNSLFAHTYILAVFPSSFLSLSLSYSCSLLRFISFIAFYLSFNLCQSIHSLLVLVKCFVKYWYCFDSLYHCVFIVIIIISSSIVVHYHQQQLTCSTRFQI